MPISGPAVYKLTVQLEEHHRLVQHELYGDGRRGHIPPEEIIPAIMRASESLSRIYETLRRECSPDDLVDAVPRLTG